MNVQLPLVQFWALMAGPPVAMILTVLVGILVNNSTTSAKIDAVQSGLQRVGGVLGAKIDGLTFGIKALEIHSPLVK